LHSPALTHKYELLKQEPHSVHKGGREWRLGSDRFPIASTIVGVVLDLEPGGLRELHWHPNADEWQYVISGQVSATMFGSHGRYRIETLEQGDVGYIPQGYGHSLENSGDQPARLLLGFNTGQYEAIDLSTWLAGNPAYLLEANLGLDRSVIDHLPRNRVFIAPKEGAPKQAEGRDDLPKSKS
jgi:oxalate decarboxylase